MKDNTISSSSLTILEKLKNLISKDSTILKGIDERKEEERNNQEVKGKEVEEYQESINTSESDKNRLETEGTKLEELLKSLNPSDYTYVCEVLGLAFKPVDDIEKLASLLPKELETREQELSELNDKLSASKKSMENSKDLLSELEIRYSEADACRLKLRDLVALAKSGEINKTREEVINILSKNSFNDTQAKQAAKLILFPEDELIPFFKDIEIEENNTKDILDSEKEPIEEQEEVVSKQVEEDQEEKALINEDYMSLETSPIIDAPISFDELRESLNSSIKAAKEEVEEINPVVYDYEEDNKESLLEETKEQEISVAEDSSFNVINETSMEDNKVSEIEPAIEITQEAKEITQISNDEEEKDLLISIGKKEEDIKLVKDLLEDNNKNDFETMINSLQEYGLDPEKIPLVAYKEGIPTLLANIDFLSQNDYELDGSEIQKFTATLFLTSPEQFKTNFEILKSYKIDLKKSNGKLALKPLAMDSAKLLDSIALLVEQDEIELIRNNPDVLSNDCKGIAERLLFCKANDIPYTEEKNNRVIYRSFVYDEEILNDLVEKKLELNNIPTKEENNDELKKITDKELVELLEEYSDTKEYYTKSSIDQNDAAYIKYMDLLKKLNAISETDADIYLINDCICGVNSTNKNLMYLVSNATNKDETNLMAVALLFNNHKTKDELEIVLDKIESGK